MSSLKTGGTPLRYLCFHNVLLYIDMDNVVLRERSTTLNRHGRGILVSLAGAPFTMGDDLTAPPTRKGQCHQAEHSLPRRGSMDVRAVSIDTSLVVENLSKPPALEGLDVVDVSTPRFGEYLRLEIAGDLHFETGDESRTLSTITGKWQAPGAFASSWI